MLRIIINKKGFTLVEVMVAMVITSIAVVSILSMVPLSMRVARNSDQIGRATGIIQAEMALREDVIMRTGVNVAEKTNLLYNVDGQEGKFYVTTTTTPVANTWVIRVEVNWTGCSNAPNPCISNTRIISRQMG